MSAAAPPRPVLWSIAGNDSGGGAGLSADARAAAAFGLHFCPVVAAITAQNSVGVSAIAATAPELLTAQLDALAQDLPPAAIKIGLLASAANVRAVAHCIRQLRQSQPHLPVVVDPVLKASSGADFANAELLQAYRHELLPLASLITPNRAEAQRLELAQHSHYSGGPSLCITGGDDAASAALSLDWLQSPQASGWLALPRQAQPHLHGTGCTFASSAAAAMALGFVVADAVVLAKMATAHAIERGYAAGLGPGPVAAQAGFMQARHMPSLSWDAQAPTALPPPRHDAAQALPDAIYAITDSLPRLQALLQAGAKLLQLRVKRPANADAAWQAALAHDIAQAIALARQHGARLYINDHLDLALAAGADALHLGQEDWQSLSPQQRQAVQSAQAERGLSLGLSSHSLWELARARSLSPSYIACGPVWATTTKDMPWLPQGQHNLACWAALAGCPVVGIGGLLEYEQATTVAAAGAAAACLVRGIGPQPEHSLPLWRAAFAQGAAQIVAPPALPRPSLPHEGSQP